MVWVRVYFSSPWPQKVHILFFCQADLLILPYALMPGSYCFFEFIPALCFERLMFA